MMYSWTIKVILLNIATLSFCDQEIDDYKEINVKQALLYHGLPPLNLSWFESEVTRQTVDRDEEREKLIKSIVKANEYSNRLSKSRDLEFIEQEDFVKRKAHFVKSPRRGNLKKRTKKNKKKVNKSIFTWRKEEPEITADRKTQPPGPLQIDVTVKDTPLKDVLFHLKMGNQMNKEVGS